MMRTSRKLMENPKPKSRGGKLPAANTAEDLQALRQELQRQSEELTRQQQALAEQKAQLASDCSAASKWIATQQEELTTLRCRLESERSALAAERATWESFRRFDHAASSSTVATPIDEQRTQNLHAEEKRLDRWRQTLGAKRRAIRLEVKDLKEQRRTWAQEQKRARTAIESQQQAAEDLRTEATYKLLEAQKETQRLEAKRRIFELEKLSRERELSALNDAIADRRQVLAASPAPLTMRATPAIMGQMTGPVIGQIPSDDLGVREWEVTAREQACIASEHELREERQRLSDLAQALERRVSEIEELAVAVADAELRQRDERTRCHGLLMDLHRQQWQSRRNGIQGPLLDVAGARPPQVLPLSRASTQIMEKAELAQRQLELDRQEDRCRWQQRIHASSMLRRERKLAQDVEMLREERREIGVQRQEFARLEQQLAAQRLEMQHERCYLLEQRILLESMSTRLLDRWNGGSDYRRKIRRLKRRLQRERCALLSREKHRHIAIQQQLDECAKLEASLRQRLKQTTPPKNAMTPSPADDATFWLAQRFRQQELRWARERQIFQETVTNLSAELDNLACAFVSPAIDEYLVVQNAA